MDGEFDYRFEGIGLLSGESIRIQYEITTNALRFGKFKAGLLETDDIYGDVSMNANSLCGNEEILWKSIPPGPRTYEKTLKEIIPAGDTTGSMNGKFTDFNQNGQPDYLDLLSGD